MTDFSGQKGLDEEKIFWTKVDKLGNHECWNYNEYCDRDGYGRFHRASGRIGAHVYSWLITRKMNKVPEDKIIMHLCNNPSCCNPNHLICGTHLQNTQHMESQGRASTSRERATPSLTIAEVWSIKELLKSKKFSQSLIAEVFKVHQSTISHINTSNTYTCKDGTYE